MAPANWLHLGGKCALPVEHITEFAHKLSQRTCTVAVAAALVSWGAYRLYQSRWLLTSDKSVLITGCDTGFGHHLALKLHRLGMQVFAGCLNASSDGAQALSRQSNGAIHVLQLDITKQDQVDAAVNAVGKALHQRSRGLWALVNNAGYNHLGVAELCSLEDDYRMLMEINFFGMVRMTKAFLPLVRQCKGRIVNVSSVKGLLAAPMNAPYCASKFAGEAFSDILRLEQQLFGVTVVIVEPGDYGGATAMLGHGAHERIQRDLDRIWNGTGTNVRQAYGQQFHDFFAPCLQSATFNECRMDIEPVLHAMAAAVLARRPAERYLVPGGRTGFDKFVWMIRCQRVLPTCLMDRLMHYFYLRGFPAVALR